MSPSLFLSLSLSLSIKHTHVVWEKEKKRETRCMCARTWMHVHLTSAPVLEQLALFFTLRYYNFFFFHHRIDVIQDVVKFN